MMKVYSRRQLMSFKLPYDAEIEYLESTGRQGINTKVVPYRGMEATIDFQFTSLHNEQCLFGCWAATVYEVTLYEGKWYFGSYSTSENTVPWLKNVADTKRHTISIDGNGSISQDNVILKTSGVTDKTSTQTVAIFGRTVRGNIQTTSMSSIRCYSFKLAKNKILVFDAIPVRVGNVGYMYDKVSGKLFGNAGTGSFILGPDKH